MNKRILTDKELDQLVGQYNAAPGIVKGIIAEHRQRGGVAKGQNASDLLDALFKRRKP